MGPIIGVFDSGVGGLTVVRALRQRWPQAELLYLGDTARVPYGTKSASVVERYAVNCARFLADRGADQLVIACNTATAYALDALRSTFSIPVTGVVEPGAALAVDSSRSGRIGVIATEGTINSASYQNALKRAKPGVEIYTQACPLFVPLAEEGLQTHAAARLLAKDYLAPLLVQGIDTLVLGCTHYPLLAPLLRDVVGPEVELIDSADAVAEAIIPPETRGTANEWCFFATDVSERVQRVGSAFLGCELPRVELVDL
ncbi:MAG: glutamate racemase [Myxococcota bacterium]